MLSAILTQLFSGRENVNCRTTQIPKGKQVYFRDEEKPAPFIQNPDSRSSPSRFASTDIRPSRQGHSRGFIPNIGRSHRNYRPPNASILKQLCGLAAFPHRAVIGVNFLQLQPGKLPDSFMTNSIFVLPHFVAQIN